MTRRQRIILQIAKRKRAHQGYRDLEARLIRLTTQQLKREIRSSK